MRHGPNKRTGLHQQHCRQHQPAASNPPDRQRLAQQYPTKERSEDRLQAEDEGSIGRRGPLLPYPLERVTQPDREHAGIEDRPPRYSHLGRGYSLETLGIAAFDLDAVEEEE